MPKLRDQLISNIKNAVSPYDNYCDGYVGSANTRNGYNLGIILETSKTKIQFSHEGSDLLDKINAFDLAEVKGSYLGQINMITVSSFCGPQGLILGYDYLQEPDLYENSDHPSYPKTVKHKGIELPVYSIDPLRRSLTEVFGTVKNKKYHIKPGAHVPCANKNIKVKGPAIIYSSLAIGIAKDRSKNACLLMEDIGQIPVDTADLEDYKNQIIKGISESIIQIGLNQRIEYKEVFAGISAISLADDEIGCALVACPYLTLARKAFLKDKNGNLDFEATIDSNMGNWLR